jgi:hypothetical protein
MLQWPLCTEGAALVLGSTALLVLNSGPFGREEGKLAEESVLKVTIKKENYPRNHYCGRGSTRLLLR